MASGECAGHFTGFEWPTVDGYRALAEQSGWQRLEVRGENLDRKFPDEATMIRWVDQPSLVPFQAHMSAPDWAAFRGFVVRRMIEETRQDDGTCFERFRRVNLSATT